MLPNGSTKGYGIAKHFLACDLIGCWPSREVLSTVKCFEDLDGDFVCLKTSGSHAWSLWSHLPICSGILCCSPSKLFADLQKVFTQKGSFTHPVMVKVTMPCQWHCFHFFTPVALHQNTSWMQHTPFLQMVLRHKMQMFLISLENGPSF